MANTSLRLMQPLDPDTRVTVMGLGLFGGGVAATRFFATRGARVTVTDLRTPEELRESVDALAGLEVTFHLGGHREEDFRSADIVVVNPAVKPDSPYLDVARGSGAELTTEVELLIGLCPAPIVGVTGSNGKSTTAALTAEVLRARYKDVWLGGNIGRPLLDERNAIDPRDWVVLELSSFQLEYLRAQGYSPPVSVVTNLSPNHLDWHGSLEAYIAAKQQILKDQTVTDIAVLNADDPEVRTWCRRTPGTSLFFSTRGPVDAGCYLEGSKVVSTLGGVTRRSSAPLRPRLLGAHNIPNILAALTVGLASGIDLEAGLKRACAFEGLPHRLEFVAEVNGVRYYNDSVATTPESALAALAAFEEPLVLIAGGKDKGIDYGGWAHEVSRRARSVLLLGSIAPTLRGLLEQQARSSAHTQVEAVGSLADAVTRARGLARPGDVVLLSPGCSSLDMFRNFEERGDLFRALVREAGSTGQRLAGEM